MRNGVIMNPLIDIIRCHTRVDLLFQQIQNFAGQLTTLTNPHHLFRVFDDNPRPVAFAPLLVLAVKFEMTFFIFFPAPAGTRIIARNIFHNFIDVEPTELRPLAKEFTPRNVKYDSHDRIVNRKNLTDLYGGPWTNKPADLFL